MTKRGRSRVVEKRSFDLDESEIEIILEVINADTSRFSELALFAYLDPATDFRGADLREISLVGDDLAGFDFSEANLRGADLRGADLSRTIGLKKENILGSRVDAHTKWPLHFGGHEQGGSDSERPFDAKEAWGMILSGSEPPAHWRPYIRHLDFSKTEIRSLRPLTRLAKLEYLDVANTSLSDFQPIANLTSLKVLIFANTNAEDALFVEKMCKLEELDFSGTKVSDVSPLSGLLELRKIGMRGTPIKNIAAVADLPKLKFIDLTDTLVNSVKILPRDVKIKTANASLLDVGRRRSRLKRTA